MDEKPTLYVDYDKGNIKGPGKIIARLFAGPKDKSWYPTHWRFDYSHQRPRASASNRRKTSDPGFSTRRNASSG